MPAMPAPSARWTVAAAAVAVHLSIGSVYAWSVFVAPLGALHGWSKPALTGAFSLAILVLGLSAAFGGGWMERNGPRKSVGISAACWGLGLVGAALAVRIGSLPLLYASYGIVGGIGLGMGYVPPVSALLKWFPDRRGLATGLAVSGFGAGALIAGPSATRLIALFGVPATFALFGAAYCCAILLASRVLRVPPAGWRPAGWQPAATAVATIDLTRGEALRTPAFWFLWGLFFLNISAGIMLISLAAPMAMEVAGLTAAEAGLLVGVMGVFNGTGRIAWSTASDWLGRPATFALLFVLEIVLFLVLPRTADALVFEIALLLILTCYGGGFALCPAFIADLFGTANAGAIYGVALTAWGAAGIVGPTLGAAVREASGSYMPALSGAAAGLALALAFTGAIARSLRRSRTGSPVPA